MKVLASVFIFFNQIFEMEMSTTTEKPNVFGKIEFLMNYVTRKRVLDFWEMNNTLYLT